MGMTCQMLLDMQQDMHRTLNVHLADNEGSKSNNLLLIHTTNPPMCDRNLTTSSLIVVHVFLLGNTFKPFALSSHFQAKQRAMKWFWNSRLNA